MNASHAVEFSFRTFTYSTDPEGRDLVGQWYGMSLVEKVHQREPLMAYLGKDGSKRHINEEADREKFMVGHARAIFGTEFEAPFAGKISA